MFVSSVSPSSEQTGGIVGKSVFKGSELRS